MRTYDRFGPGPDSEEIESDREAQWEKEDDAADAAQDDYDEEE